MNTGFELVKASQGAEKKKGSPRVTLTPNGSLSGNPSVLRKLKNPRFVQVFFNKDLRQLMIMPCSESDEFKIRTRNSGQSIGFMATCEAFATICKMVGIKKKTTFECVEQDEGLIIDFASTDESDYPSFNSIAGMFENVSTLAATKEKN